MTTTPDQALTTALLAALLHAPLAAQAVQWTATTATGPAARHRHAIAYDSLRARTVLFGGIASTGGAVADTWEYNGNTWTQMASTGPSGRSNHAMAYDSLRQRTVLFGGRDSNNVPIDTWEWDGNAWSQVAASGPLARLDHAMVYDSLRQRTVLFGGGFHALFSDTWEWDGNAWTQALVNGPSVRHEHAMAYDSLRQRAVLFGGSNLGPLSDTWEYNGNEWTQVMTSGPEDRHSHAMVYDSLRGITVLFGGIDNGGTLDDTWEWSGDFTSTANSFGNGCGNPALALTPIANARPTIGNTAQLALGNMPTTVALILAGWSRTSFGPHSLPFGLAGYGMPGCDLLQSAEHAMLPTASTGPGAATFSLPVPNNPGLIGLRLYLQGWAFAPNANAGDAIISNGVEWAIGNL